MGWSGLAPAARQAAGGRRQVLHVDGADVRRVSVYKHLGARVRGDGSMCDEITARGQTTYAELARLRPVFSHQE